MTEIRRKEMEFLDFEIAGWVERHIISAEQASEILSLYDVKKRNLRMIMLTAGVILLGMGALSFLLAHWHEFEKDIRVCMISGAYIASLLAYLFTRKNYPKTAKSLLLLSAGIFGGGIYLITRMYEIPITLGEFLGYWITEVIIVSVIFRDEWQLYLACVLSLVWMNETDAVNAFALYFVRTARVPVSEFFEPLYAFMLVAALWASWFSLKDRIAFMMCMLLTLLLLASRMSLCFGGTWTLIILAVTGAVMSFLSGSHDSEVMGMMMAGVFGLLLTWPMFWRGVMFAANRDVLPVVNAVIVAVIMLAGIWRGHLGTGITFCALLTARYFFDHIFGFLPKAWGFTLTGIIFVAAGLSFGRMRKFFVKE